MKEDVEYNALRDHEDDSQSGTEVDEELTYSQSRCRRRNSRSLLAKAKSYSWLINIALLLVILGLLVERRWSGSDGEKKQKGHRYEFTGDITGFAPTFSQQIVTFTPNETFAPNDPIEFWSNKTQDAWLSIVPKGLGYLQVKEPSLYSNLPHPLRNYPNSTVFTTSMTHQLHCLHAILDGYNKLLVYSDPSLIDMPWHINHCFEYMRQAIMCAGDVALEGAETTFPPTDDGDMGGSDGWDAKHVCKDYREVYEYLERETVPGGEKWI